LKETFNGGERKIEKAGIRHQASGIRGQGTGKKVTGDQWPATVEERRRDREDPPSFPLAFCPEKEMFGCRGA
jgi:hypothetical protein